MKNTRVFVLKEASNEQVTDRTELFALGHSVFYSFLFFDHFDIDRMAEKEMDFRDRSDI